MSIAEQLAIKAESKRAQILSHIDPESFRWAVPIMRAGYAGRGLVYLLVAGLSLWSIWWGGQAQGTKSAMQSLDGIWGTLIVALIASGMFAYAIWRAVDCIWDLEAYGRTPKGIIARAGMIATGVAHAGIGVLALSVLGFRAAQSSGGGSSSGSSMLSTVMQADGGRWLVGIAGALTIAAGIYYLYKAIAQTYRQHLQANEFTLNWNILLQAGVLAQGIVVAIIGGLILYAALQDNPAQAGGLQSVFDWLRSQTFGYILVILLCLGLLGFSLFCFVNAAYRIVPKAADGSVQTIAAKMAGSASGHDRG